MARVRVRMDSAPVFYIKVMGPGTSVDRNMRGRARRVRDLAVVLAPKQRGNLARSVSVNQNRDERGRYTFGFTVSASASYAMHVHEGTRPSRRSKWPGAMRFAGTNEFAGQIIFAETVYHPGNAANPFLRRALAAAAY